MGTKVRIDSYMPGLCSMRDLSRESNGASWPPYYVDSNFPNGEYYGFRPTSTSYSHSEYDKDVVKQTMLEHEVLFKNQVIELHRLYQVQRDLMDEVRRKEQIKGRIPYETSSSSGPAPSDIQHDNMRRWKNPAFPLAHSVADSSIPGTGTVQSSSLSVKGKSIQAGPSSLQNRCNPKNSEVSESRPTKCRRKMIDLELPADEYIDPEEVEQFGDIKVSDNITPSPDKNKYLCENGNPFLNCSGKTKCQGYASRSDSHITKTRALADLNEPLHLEEITVVSSIDFSGAVASNSDVQYRDCPDKLFSSLKDVPQRSVHRSFNGVLSNKPFENGSNGRDWFCHASESEHKGNGRSINKETPSSSQPMRSLLDQLTQPPTFVTCDRINRDTWRENHAGNPEKSDRSYTLPSYNMPEPILSSHVPNQSSLFRPSGLGMTRDQCSSSWSKPSGFLSQKSPVLASPNLDSAALSKSPQSSAQSNDFFGNKWNLNSIPGVNAVYGGESSVRHGFYEGSSCSSKLPGWFPPMNFDYAKPAIGIDFSTVKDMNLNVPYSNGVSYGQTVQPNLKVVNNNKSKDPLAVLPWLRGNGSCNKETENSKNGHPFAVISCDDNGKSKKLESSDCPSSRKILGVPIFEKPPTPKIEEVGSSWRKGEFDMNLPCEPSDSELDTMNGKVVAIEKRTENETASVRIYFDLNSCVTEEESPCGTVSVKGDTGIDLEAPVMVESEDDVPPVKVHLTTQPDEKHPESPPDQTVEVELAKSAADMIVAISSSVSQNQSLPETAFLPPTEASEEEMLRWFVDIACTNGNDLESHMIPDQKDNNGDQDQNCLPEGLDDYESMILRLKECTVNEYFPKSSIPKFPNMEENGPSVLTTRTRKGHARRGRQRRDFQRDILPGLISLSRHEVTEDLQTFGGIMRATGHPWHSAPNRRNATRKGCGRGRPRSVQVASAPENTVFPTSKQISSSNTEVMLEDRCLTGWGKTTRRPRRQRHPSGNPPPSLLSI